MARVAWSTAWRWARRSLYVVLALVVAVLVLLASAQTYVNTDAGRRRIESLLSSVLDQDVTAGGLELHLLSGLTLEDVKLVPRGELAAFPFVIADELNLGYSLTELVHGRLRIDQLAANGARVAVVYRGGRGNLPMSAPVTAAPGAPVVTAPPVPAAAPGGAPPAPAPPPATAGAGAAPKPRGLVIPPIPVTIALDAVRLADVTVLVDLDGQRRIEARGLDLARRGHAGASGTDLALEVSHRPGADHDVRVSLAGGRPIELRAPLELRLAVRGEDLSNLAAELALALPGATIDLGAGARPVTVKLAARATTALADAKAELHDVTLDLGRGGTIALGGTVEDFLAAPRVDATIERAHFDVAELLPLAAAFLPELTASGAIEIEGLKAKGDLKGGTERDPFRASGRIVLADLAASVPAARVEASGLAGSIELDSVSLVHYRPSELAVRATLGLARAALPDGGRIEGLDVRLDSTAKGGDLRDVHAAAVVHAAVLVPPALGAGARPLSLDAEVSTAADLTTGDLRDVRARVSVPRALALTATGEVGAFGKGAVKLAAQLDTQPGPLLELVPPSLLGTLPRPTASGTVKLAAEATGDLGRGELSTRGRVVLDRLGAGNLPAAVTIGRVNGEVGFELALTEGFRVGPARLDGKLAVERLDALQAAHVPSASLTVSAKAGGVPLDSATAKLDLALTGAHYKTRDLETPPQDVRLTVSAGGNPAAGDLTLESLDLAVNRVAHLTARGTVRGFGREALEVTSHLDGLELASLALKLPRSVGAAVSGISATGAPTFDAAVKGRLPTPEEIEALTLPLTGHVALELPKGSFSWPARQIRVEKASTKVGVTFDPAKLAVAVDAAVFGFVDAPHFGSTSRDAALAVRAALEDRDRLTVSQVHLGILNQGAFAFVGGEVAGLRRILDERELPPVGELLRTLAGRVEVAAGLYRPDPLQVAPGVSIGGGTSNRITVKLRPGRDVAIDGQASFADFVVKGDGLDVNGLSGRFPIQKTLAVVGPAPKGEVARRATASSADLDSIAERNRSLYGSLRPLSTNRDNLRLASLLAGTFAAHDVYLDVGFSQRALLVQRFGVGLLGGWVGGSAETSFSPARNRLHFQTEFGEIDLRRLLPLDDPLSDDEAQLSGTARIALDLARGEGDGPVSLGDINAELNLTRIGEEALDQLLAFLDPRGDQSSISTFRTILGTTDLTISRVQIPVQNGSLTLRVDYGIHAHVPRVLERALNIVYDTTNHFEIPSIPLLRLQNVEKLKPIFDRLEQLEPILDIVGGDHIQIDPDGSARIE